MAVSNGPLEPGGANMLFRVSVFGQQVFIQCASHMHWSNRRTIHRRCCRQRALGGRLQLGHGPDSLRARRELDSLLHLCTAHAADIFVCLVADPVVNVGVVAGGVGHDKVFELRDLLRELRALAVQRLVAALQLHLAALETILPLLLALATLGGGRAVPLEVALPPLVRSAGGGTCPFRLGGRWF